MTTGPRRVLALISFALLAGGCLPTGQDATPDGGGRDDAADTGADGDTPDGDTPDGDTPDDGAQPDAPTLPPPTGIGGTWTAQASNTTAYLTDVWGTDGSNVWVSGSNGTMLFHNGSTWQVRPTNTTNPIKDIDGTSASSVFAMTNAEILTWNGTAWSKTSTGLSTLECMTAIDDATALVGWIDRDPALQKAYIVLSRFENGALTELDRHVLQGFYVSARRCSLHEVGDGSYLLGVRDSQELDPGKIFTWDGVDLVDRVTNASTRIYLADATHVFIESGPNLTLWDRAASFQIVNTGYTGKVFAITGNSPTRVFALGNSYPAGLQAMKSSAVLYYDGLGWVTEALPRPVVNDSSMRAIFAVPTGEVFAVGDDGMVFKKGL